MAAPDWENPRLYQRNKEPGRTLALPYDSLEEALSSPRDESPWKQSLNGKWNFSYYASVQNLPDRIFEACDQWNTITVPGVWELQGYGKPYYLAYSYPPSLSTCSLRIPSIRRSDSPVGVYHRKFFIDSSWLEREVYLHIGAAKSALRVFVNEHEIGYSQGSMTPAEFCISRHIKTGLNSVGFVVYRYSDGTYLEDQDMWFFSGIYRDVYITAEPKTHIWDFFCTQKFSPSYDQVQLSIQVFLRGALDKARHVEAIVTDFHHPHTAVHTAAASEFRPVSHDRSEISLCFSLDHPKLWNAETPNVYMLVLLVRDLHGSEVTVKRMLLGLRDVRIVGEQLCVNGKPIRIHGVNRHDFDPDHGWAVPRFRYHQDIRLMKQHNINAIRTSHYPNNPYLYDLCSIYGIYVMDEADLETHGVRKLGIPGSRPEWKAAAIDRVERMILRDRNYPCVCMWSLGNEAGFGVNFHYMKEAGRALDPSRPFHYEGDTEMSVSDIYSRMYPTPDMINAIEHRRDRSITVWQRLMNLTAAENRTTCRSHYEGKPVLMCEFAHAMGNSLGNFHVFTDAFERCTHLAGGYVWDFADQVIRMRDELGNTRWLYGGDFGEKKTNGNFCANGICSADRAAHPALYELKTCYQFISCRFTQESSNRISCTIRNNYAFFTLTHVKIFWVVLEDGVPKESGKMDAPLLEPGTSSTLHISFMQGIDFSREVILHLSFKTDRDLPWAERGHELAWFQHVSCVPSHRTNAFSAKTAAPMEVYNTGSTVIILGQMVRCVVDLATGHITEIDFGEGNILLEPAVPNFWRPLTDNDREYANFVPALRILQDRSWEHATKRFKLVSLHTTAPHVGMVCVTVLQQRKNFHGPVELTYTIESSGRVCLSMEGKPTKDLIRFGFTLPLPISGSQISQWDCRWYGRGPHETYCDRKLGAPIGIHSVRLDRLDPELYVRPQEYGNRTDVRWFALMNRHTRQGLLCSSVGNDVLEFSARMWSQDEIEAADHVHELPVSRGTYLQIDHCQRGVGGDIPGFISLHRQYALPGRQTYAYTFSIEKKNDWDHTKDTIL